MQSQLEDLDQGMHDPDQCSGSDQPGGIDPESQQQDEADQNDKDDERVDDGSRGELDSDPQHQVHALLGVRLHALMLDIRSHQNRAKLQFFYPIRSFF